MEKTDKKVWKKPMINNLSIKHITLSGTVSSQGESHANSNTSQWRPGSATSGS